MYLPFSVVPDDQNELQCNPYNADTLRNRLSVLIIGVSSFQGYSITIHIKAM